MYFSPSADKTTREGLIKTMSEDDSVESNEGVADILLKDMIMRGDTGDGRKLEIRGSQDGTGKVLRLKKKSRGQPRGEGGRR